MIYKKLYMLGTGKLFLECMKYVQEKNLPYIGYDMGDKPNKMTKLQAEKLSLCYHYEDKKRVYEAIKEESEPVLLLSIINPCIIPTSILEKKNVKAINCHQALLPEHKGRNAEAWAIYEGDSKTGITWHKMTPEVDAGEILIQKEIVITEDMTSFQLFLKQLQIALDGFKEILPELIEGKETYTIQKEGGSFRYSYETPEDGKLDFSWGGDKLSRFLRALDYGGMSIMKSPYFIWNGEPYNFKSYSIKREQYVHEESVEFEEDTLRIEKQEYTIVLKKCKKIIN